MKKNLLIVGAGVYSALVKELALATKLYNKIDFIDDVATISFNGDKVVGKVSDMANLLGEYNCAIVAIGNPEVRLQILDYIKANTNFEIVSIISPLSAISPSAIIEEGCVIENMAVVSTACKIKRGAFICAGAVVNHASVVGSCSQIDCNAVVSGQTQVPDKTKVKAGEVFN